MKRLFLQFILIFCMSSNLTIAQKTVPTLITLSKQIPNLYTRNPDGVLSVFDGLKQSGFIIKSHEYKVTGESLDKRTDTFSFNDVNSDGISEELQISTSFSRVGVTPTYTVTIFLTTDSFTQYNKWISDIRTTKDFKKTMNLPFVETYEQQSILSPGAFIVSISIPFKITVNNTPRQERLEANPTGAYKIYLYRTVVTL